MCFSTTILSCNVMWCSFHTMADNDFLYSSSAYHRESVVGWRPCFPCRAFLSMSRPVLQLLSFRRSVLLSTTAVFLDHISRDWGDVTVVQFELCWTPRTLHISSTTAIEYSYFPLGIAVWTSVLFKDFGVVQVGDQVLRFFAELVDLLRLAQVLNEWFLMFVVLELLDQPFDFVLAYCILRFDCRKVLRYFVIHDVVTRFPVTFRIARWFPGWSCFLALWILWAILQVRF